jgi:hypothetical protein
MAFTLQATLKQIEPEQQVSANFRKRPFVVEYAENANYPQLLQFECSQQRCDLIDGYSVGDRVEISFNLKGREWLSPKGEKKYFLTLDVWKIARPGTQPAQPGGNNTSSTAYPSAEELKAYEADDLPF